RQWVCGFDFETQFASHILICSRYRELLDSRHCVNFVKCSWRPRLAGSGIDGGATHPFDGAATKQVFVKRTPIDHACCFLNRCRETECGSHSIDLTECLLEVAIFVVVCLDAGVPRPKPIHFLPLTC